MSVIETEKRKKRTVLVISFDSDCYVVDTISRKIIYFPEFGYIEKLTEQEFTEELRKTGKHIKNIAFREMDEEELEV
ncbi:MAG: hypothetical protein QXT14_02950 [Candidatus Bathyarchaeia archaeon]